MFKPFANDTDALNIAGDAINIVNDTTRVTVSGDLTITRDKAGLANALALYKALGAIVATLQGDASLPAKLQDEPDKLAGKTDNPFI
ncbi:MULTISPECIES: hypothetical protein [unclassified Caballeronia]|uniref:hypothetical protein n=1 Tax=unclassified Caballeronia TaxID=2646786 RepID=UPI0028670C0E|nr:MULTISPECIES: hypothetical protein [unclassified Caballeronia]MDR5818395.1 hypothetical protein [Caballeronia sp. LZ033]MDR5883238.1 hypothetical protein [Caballeronia sp. LZ032]